MRTGRAAFVDDETLMRARDDASPNGDRHGARRRNVRVAPHRCSVPRRRVRYRTPVIRGARVRRPRARRSARRRRAARCTAARPLRPRPAVELLPRHGAVFVRVPAPENIRGAQRALRARGNRRDPNADFGLGQRAVLVRVDAAMEADPSQEGSENPLQAGSAVLGEAATSRADPAEPGSARRGASCPCRLP